MSTARRSTLEEPDYRYTLANERTFLAWIRTSLTFLAGAVAFDQFAPGSSPRWLTLTVTVLLALLGFLSCLAGLQRWRHTTRALAQRESISSTTAPYLLAAGVTMTAVAVLVIAATARP